MDSAYPESGYSPSHANGYTNGNLDIDDESDDDDSNPLEDLEALGDIEEQENQIREDEEGLRNARELARQGFEGSNTAEKGIELVNGTAGIDEHATRHQPDGDGMVQLGRMDEDIQPPAVVHNHDAAVHTHESDVPVSNHGTAHQVAYREDVTSRQDDAKPALHAGLQAVNGTVVQPLRTSE